MGLVRVPGKEWRWTVTSRRVLVVEDDLAQQALLIGRLMDLGYSVLAVRTVTEAVNALAKPVQIEIMILDLHLPNGHGFEVLRTLAQARNDLPVVVVSAYPEDKDVEMPFPILQWIDKPYTAEALERAMELADKSADSIERLKKSTRHLERSLERK